MTITGTAPTKQIWITDTTPIIILAKIGHLDLLTDDTRDIWLPNQVTREIRQGPVADPARLAVEADWGVRVAVNYIPVAVRALGLLDPGEQAVLALAGKHPDCVVVLDDDRGRRAARQLGLSVIGTLGVIMLGKQQGKIPAVVPLFHAVQAAGLYVIDHLLRTLATSEGESWP